MVISFDLKFTLFNTCITKLHMNIYIIDNNYYDDLKFYVLKKKLFRFL